MNLLTFDTSLDKTYVVLSADDKILSSEIIENHNQKYHSAFLIPAIVKMLKDNKMTMQDINAIGTNVGPGSFTGIRACVTVARVFAQQLNVPLVGVSSLEILSCINDSVLPTLVILDARKKQHYVAIYDTDGSVVQEPKLRNFDDVVNIDFDKYFVISDEASLNLLNLNKDNTSVYTDINAELGVYLNKIVYNKLSSSSQVDEYVWGKLKPLYLQAPPVSICANINAH